MLSSWRNLRLQANVLHADLKPDNFLIDELPPLEFRDVGQLLPGGGSLEYLCSLQCDNISLQN